MKETIIKFSVKKVLYLVMASAIFTFIGIWFIYYVLEHYNDIGYQSTKLLRNKNFSLFMSIIGILFFGGGGSIAVFMIIKHRVKYIISSTGIEVFSAKRNSLIIEWRDVKTISIYKIGSLVFLCVSLIDIKRWKEKFSGLKIKMIELNLKKGHPPVMINLSLTKEKPEEVLSTMNKYWEEWKVNNQIDEVHGVGKN